MNLSYLLYGTSTARKPVIGVDLGKTAIKMVELDGDSLNKVRLLNYAIQPLPLELVNAETLMLEAYAEEVKKCWAKLKTKTKDVAICLSSSQVISKKILMDLLEEEEEAVAQVQSELSSYIPINVNDINFDFQDFGASDHTPTEKDLLLVAARKEKIDEKVAIMEKSWLNPIFLDNEAFLVENMLHVVKPANWFDEKVVMFIDVGAEMVKMYAFKDYDNIYSRELQMGTRDLVQGIMSYSNKEYLDALTELESNNLENNENYDYVIKPYLSNLAQEIARSTQFFLNANAINNIDEIYLFGGLVGHLAFDETIKTELENQGVTTIYEKVNIFNNINTDKIAINKLELDKSGLVIATNLALKGILK